MSTYHPFSNEEAIAYVKEIPNFFSEESNLVCREIGDGNLNLVFHISDQNTAKSIIVKQALPYAKVVGESWPLSLDRARIEREALQIQHNLSLGHVPIVYAYDEELALTVMEDLSDHVIMRQGLINGEQYPLFAEHIGEFLANTLFYTSDLALNPVDKKEQSKKFINPDLCKITEDLIFEDPYHISDNNNYPVTIEDEAQSLRDNLDLHLEVALLREKFLTQSQALLHGDLHTGSIFVTQTSTKVIDPEFAYYGPMGFDIGAVIANLILNYVAQPGWNDSELAVQEKEAQLLLTVANVWKQFESSFRALWNKDVQDLMARTPGYQDLYITRVLQDTVGFAGCKIIRRIVGLAHVADIDTIVSVDLKEVAQRKALAIGKQLILNHRHISSIEELLRIVQDTNPTSRQGATS
ncbi:S-methyl-5-thioribose kinase [Paenibacillus antarcticus]|uniref:Methylthioribose kinase n=1 Tax=Paenibacillus antarcticus TaxID=253703 RepID=A0A168LTZ0_9BACL|nr:S-methyl-5-thioribose kinase [Paenibacillus antarcticus]OAB43831.1 S-methyl-5-thioribose kinase [Paenibacillus antarcticus]